jgi:sulfur-oxidizing protein SoxX
MVGALGLMGCTATAARDTVASSPASSSAVSIVGDAARGREVVMGRDGNCLLCHAIPETGARFSGNLGPSLSGIGARFGARELRLRLVNPRQFNPDSIMPAYSRTEGLTQVGKPWQGKPILSSQQIEDTVVFLTSLR